MSTHTSQETAPTLSNPTVDSVSENSATLSVTTDKFGPAPGNADGGVVYGAIRLAADPAPTHDEIVLGTALLPPVIPPPPPPPPEPPPTGTSHHEEDFESGVMNYINFPTGPDPWFNPSIQGVTPLNPAVSEPFPDLQDVSTDFARLGTFSLRVTIDRDLFPNQYRSQCTMSQNDMQQFGPVYWYAWSIYVPDDYQDTSTWEQWQTFHNFADDWGAANRSKNAPTQFGPGGTKGSRELFTSIAWTKDIQNPDGVTTRIIDSGRSQSIGTIDSLRGVWTDYVFEVRWAAKVEDIQNGIYKLYINSELAIDWSFDQIGTGNCYNDIRAPYLIFGMYTGWLQNPELDPEIRQHTIYWDNFRLNIGGTYNDVAPR